MPRPPRRALRVSPMLATTLWCLAAAVCAAGPARSEAGVDATAKRIERQVIAPCCFRDTVDVHDSPAAHQVRAEIRALLAAGAGEQEALDALTRKYGERILAAPRPSGFGLLAYLVPSVALLAAVAGATRACAARRGRAPRAPGVAPAHPVATLDPALRARLEAALAELDGAASPPGVRVRAG